MAPRIVERADRAFGERLEQLSRSHHRRRLGRLGHEQALDPTPQPHAWADGEPGPRAGNELEVLVDGAAALPAIAKALEGARSHINIAGWHLAPDFRLTRNGGPRLRELLAELARRVDVRVLLWAGAPLPLFKPHRSDVRAGRDELTRGTRIRCALDSKERPMHCHHEKLVIVDDRIAFVGGIDLTSLAGDRFDSSEHRLREQSGWHDCAVRLRGPAVADVGRHFGHRWQEVAGEKVSTQESAAVGAATAQIVRTVPERVYRFAPRGEFRILEAYLRALRSAREFIYVENQFLWSPEIVAVLAEKLRRPPTDGFRLLILLPANPNNGADDTRGQLGALTEADDGAERLLACSIYSRLGARAKPVYVHAKVAIVDDAWLTVGSANLNEHSLFNDTEVNVITCEREIAHGVRSRLWSEHLELSPDDVSGDPAKAIDELWRPVADEQLQRLRAGAALSHKVVRLSGVSRRSRRLSGPITGFLVDG
jgi:phosphatidylserine/phosphatidylglycerophosphate/cardiolipin synthase-like enzyme